MSDLFGVKGRQFLRELEELPEVEKIVLTSNLKALEALETEIAAIEKELNLKAIALPGNKPSFRHTGNRRPGRPDHPG